MKKIKVQQLSVEKFHRYGTYAQMIGPKSDATGPKDAELVFFRDMVQQTLSDSPSFSTLLVRPRPFVISVGEYHDFTCEVSMPLDNDALVWVAPAGATAEVPVDDIEVFFVPKGTLLCIRPGVWHHAAFTPDKRNLNVMIVLPERAYMTDCHVAEIPAKKQLEIKL